MQVSMAHWMKRLAEADTYLCAAHWDTVSRQPIFFIIDSAKDKFLVGQSLLF